MLWIPGIILGCIFGYWLYCLAAAIAQLFFGPILGYRFAQASLLGLYVMRTDGKLKFGIGEVSWFPEVLLEAKSMPYWKRVLKEVGPLLFGAALEYLLFLLMPEKGSFDWHICVGTMIGLALFMLIHLCIMIGFLANVCGKGKKAEFWRENDRVLELIRQGIHPRDIAFLDESEDKLFLDAFRRQYDFIIYYKALETGDLETMGRYIEKMKPCIQMDWSIAQTPMYYEVIYYLAKYEKNIGLTETYVSKVLEVMKKDKDVNGRRVYASYLYYSGKDKNLAMQTAKEGLQAAEKYALKGLAYMERDLLTELIYEMEENKYEKYN